MVDLWNCLDRFVPEGMSQVWRRSEVGNTVRRSQNSRLSAGSSAGTFAVSAGPCRNYHAEVGTKNELWHVFDTSSKKGLDTRSSRFEHNNSLFSFSRGSGATWVKLIKSTEFIKSFIKLTKLTKLNNTQHLLIHNIFFFNTQHLFFNTQHLFFNTQHLLRCWRRWQRQQRSATLVWWCDEFQKFKGTWTRFGLTARVDFFRDILFSNEHLLDWSVVPIFKDFSRRSAWMFAPRCCARRNRRQFKLS